LLHSDLVSRALAADVWLKNETITPIASFKFRGALNAMIKAKAEGARGAVTSSTGNHGQGVAYAARVLGVSADIFLPDPANPIKAAMIRMFGGTVHVTGDDIDEAKDAALQFADDHGGLFLDDGEDVDIMEGAGTVGLEVAEALSDIDLLVVPLGGGNLTAGCATALKAIQPQARVVSVQAKGSPAVTKSFHARKIVEHPIDTLADGLVTRVPPTLALNVLWDLLDDAWLASDEQLLAGVHTLAECAHILVEPAGAAALAGVFANREGIRGKRIVLILTGANIAMAQLEQAMATRPFFSIDT
jgi:threonine dehydratase